ncbi:hypothetical protein LX32DRAFT_401333 [Colletotrichum zoysiae]|uniref:Uncharacterized protein n=1 Tax=Colletotrichum zoysiae TaxID=1216348 RepID=A0AAD9HGE5_9PEZI|nr:hypothetical protein LX32DRAFT_401333 [Colletotrichum zoysiae]
MSCCILFSFFFFPFVFSPLLLFFPFVFLNLPPRRFARLYFLHLRHVYAAEKNDSPYAWRNPKTGQEFLTRGGSRVRQSFCWRGLTLNYLFFPSIPLCDFLLMRHAPVSPFLFFSFFFFSPILIISYTY